MLTQQDKQQIEGEQYQDEDGWQADIKHGTNVMLGMEALWQLRLCGQCCAARKRLGWRGGFMAGAAVAGVRRCRFG